ATTKRSMTDATLEPRDGPPLPPNGEVARPADVARSEPRAHAVPRRPRRTTTHPSRPAPTIVRRHANHCPGKLANSELAPQWWAQRTLTGKLGTPPSRRTRPKQ